MINELSELVAAKRLYAEIEAVYDLHQIVQAVTAAAREHRAGKIVIVPHH